MIIKNNKIYLAGLILLLLLAPSCSRKKVIITRDYVICPNWDKHSNFFSVTRMILKDSTATINLKDPSEPELYYGLVKDSNYSYYANVRDNGEEYSKRKVYFNSDNGFLWGKEYEKNTYPNIKILGELKQETWYMLGGLSNVRGLYYVYIDSIDSFHVFNVSTMTNF